MPLCFFASDLHGHVDRYRKLWERIRAERPAAVFLGGDLLPAAFSAVDVGAAADAGDAAADAGDAAAAAGAAADVDDAAAAAEADFLGGFLVPGFRALRDDLQSNAPDVFLILGNDDPRAEEESVLEAMQAGVWQYVHDRRASIAGHDVYGYACVPPTPFLLKDWERYDVSRFVDPGCVSPEEGHRSVAVPENEVRYATIQQDLQSLVGDRSVAQAIFLFHSPPYGTNLDRAALDDRMVDHVPVDVHVGSIAIQRFIEQAQPLVTLHGHVHESARLTGQWSQRIGRTHCFSAAHDGPELALVRFDPDDLEHASRRLETC